MPEGRVADFQTKVSFLREAGYGKFDTIHKADLKISDIGNLLGSDWVMVAHELEIPDSDINIIKTEYPENEGWFLYTYMLYGLKNIMNHVLICCFFQGNKLW